MTTLPPPTCEHHHSFGVLVVAIICAHGAVVVLRWVGAQVLQYIWTIAKLLAIATTVAAIVHAMPMQLTMESLRSRAGLAWNAAMLLFGHFADRFHLGWTP